MSDQTPGTIGSGVAYIHPQGIVPDGMYIEEASVQSFIEDGILSQCEGCGSEDPDFPTYAINGDEAEEVENLSILEAYEVVV